MRKKKNSSKNANDLKVRNIILSGVRFIHGRSFIILLKTNSKLFYLKTTHTNFQGQGVGSYKKEGQEPLH